MDIAKGFPDPVPHIADDMKLLFARPVTHHKASKKLLYVATIQNQQLFYVHGQEFCSSSTSCLAAAWMVPRLKSNVKMERAADEGADVLF